MPISDEKREDYITANERELTQLAIHNRFDNGAGALYIELDDEKALKDGNIKVMYFTAAYLATKPQFADILEIITSSRSHECVYLVHNNEKGVSIVREKQLT